MDWDWVNQFDEGDEEYIYCLIMTLLTHVQQLNLFRFSSDGFCFKQTIQYIAYSNSAEALSRLTKVTVCQELDNASAGDIDRLHYATTIPSVKVIEARGIGRERDVCNCRETFCCEDCWKSFDDHDYWCHATETDIYMSQKRGSAATHLTLSNCQLNRWRLSEFLARLRKLESFIYSARMEPSYIQPQALIDVLLEYGKQSLQTLHLRSIERVTDRQVVLADFEVMTELDIEYNLLIDKRAASPRTKLADALPRSIEKVHLRRPSTNEHCPVEGVLLDMVGDKTERLPNLTEVALKLHYIEGGMDLELRSRLEKMYADVGVALRMTGVSTPIVI